MFMDISTTGRLLLQLLDHHVSRDLDDLVRLGNGRLGRGSSSAVLDRLQADGLVRVRSDGFFHLTEPGSALAMSLR